MSDDAAKYFFASLKLYLETDAGLRHALVSGHDIERMAIENGESCSRLKELREGTGAAIRRVLT